MTNTELVAAVRTTHTRTNTACPIKGDDRVLWRHHPPATGCCVNRLPGKMASEEILRPFFFCIERTQQKSSASCLGRVIRIDSSCYSQPQKVERKLHMKPAPKSPCRECPFRRVSPNGYLGAATPDNFIRSTLTTEVGMPCHLTVDYEDPDWLKTMETDASFCRGSLIFLRNSCKLPRAAAYCQAVLETEPDRTTVFSHAAEFLEHHTSPIQPRMKRKRGKAAQKARR